VFHYITFFISFYTSEQSIKNNKFVYKNKKS
jgi:hypothetical protein